MLGLALSGSKASEVVTEIGLLDVDPGRASASLRRGAGDRVLPGMDEVLLFETVVLALPVPEIVGWLERFGGSVRPGTFVVDTGSAKGAVVAAMRRFLGDDVRAVGGHPMAGTERPGPEGADDRLLRGAAFVLCPVRDDPAALALGRLLAEAVGSRPVEMGAEAHDRVVAVTSHLPHLMAYALAATGGDASARGERVAALASTGFGGATRLASSDPEMVAGCLCANAAEVRRAAADFCQALSDLLEALDEGPGAVAGALEASRASLPASVGGAA
jgi:prephenate dehydrogenase